MKMIIFKYFQKLLSFLLDKRLVVEIEPDLREIFFNICAHKFVFEP